MIKDLNEEFTTKKKRGGGGGGVEGNSSTEDNAKKRMYLTGDLEICVACCTHTDGNKQKF